MGVSQSVVTGLEGSTQPLHFIGIEMETQTGCETLGDQHCQLRLAPAPTGNPSAQLDRETGSLGPFGCKWDGDAWHLSRPHPPTFSQVKIGSSHQEAQPILSPCGGCSGNNAQRDGRPHTVGGDGGRARTPCPQPLREWAPGTLCARSKCLAQGQTLAAASGQSRMSQTQLRPPEPANTGSSTYHHFRGPGWAPGGRASQGIATCPEPLF